MSEISLTMQFRKYEIHPQLHKAVVLGIVLGLNNILIRLFYYELQNLLSH